jgi:hypothetical protein
MNSENIKTILTIFDNKSDIDILIPYIICIIFILITIYYIIRINMTMSKSNWEKNKCLPKFMFVSGFIQKEPGLNVLGSTIKNFKQCIQDGLPFATPSINIPKQTYNFGKSIKQTY